MLQTFFLIVNVFMVGIASCIEINLNHDAYGLYNVILSYYSRAVRVLILVLLEIARV